MQGKCSDRVYCMSQTIFHFIVKASHCICPQPFSILPSKSFVVKRKKARMEKHLMKVSWICKFFPRFWQNPRFNQNSNKFDLNFSKIEGYWPKRSQKFKRNFQKSLKIPKKLKEFVRKPNATEALGTPWNPNNKSLNYET